MTTQRYFQILISDMSKGYEFPPDTFFWPPDAVQSLRFDENEAERENVEDISVLQKGDESDSNSEKDSDDEEEESQMRLSAEELKKPELELEPSEMLPILTQYLRCEHHYCLWCGITFTNIDDLEQNCPGPTRDDHD